MDFRVSNVSLISNGQSLKASFDLTLILNPAANTDATPGHGNLAIYRCGYFRVNKDTGVEAFVGGPSFPKKDAEGKTTGYIKSLSLPRSMNAAITAAVETQIRAAVANAVG